MNRKNHPTDQTSQGTILKQRMRVALFWTLVIQGSVCVAQVPGLLSYQGRVAVGAANFEGSGQFKFALVNSNAATRPVRSLPATQ